MEKNIINPWTWQDARNYVQAVEIKNPESILYISGQTAIDENGVSSDERMRPQLLLSLKNLETVIKESGYELSNIARLNIYTTSCEELFKNFDVIQNWITENGIKQASTVLEVKSLFETLTVELEATLAR